MAFFIVFLSYIYIKNLSLYLDNSFRFFIKIIKNKWYFDQFYSFLFVKPTKVVGSFFWKSGDIKTIDRFGEEIHPISKEAKDIASASVFLAISFAIFVWIIILV